MSSENPSSTHGIVGRVFRLALDIILGIIAGIVLTLIVVNLLFYAEGRSVFTALNGWSITMKAGRPGNSFLLRALMAAQLPAANVAEESVYWITAKDSTG